MENKEYLLKAIKSCICDCTSLQWEVCKGNLNKDIIFSVLQETLSVLKNSENEIKNNIYKNDLVSKFISEYLQSCLEPNDQKNIRNFIKNDSFERIEINFKQSNTKTDYELELITIANLLNEIAGYNTIFKSDIKLSSGIQDKYSIIINKHKNLLGYYLHVHQNLKSFEEKEILQENFSQEELNANTCFTYSSKLAKDKDEITTKRFKKLIELFTKKGIICYFGDAFGPSNSPLQDINKAKEDTAFSITFAKLDKNLVNIIEIEQFYITKFNNKLYFTKSSKRVDPEINLIEIEDFILSFKIDDLYKFCIDKYTKYKEASCIFCKRMFEQPPKRRVHKCDGCLISFTEIHKNLFPELKEQTVVDKIREDAQTVEEMLRANQEIDLDKKNKLIEWLKNISK